MDDHNTHQELAQLPILLLSDDSRDRIEGNAQLSVLAKDGAYNRLGYEQRQSFNSTISRLCTQLEDIGGELTEKQQSMVIALCSAYNKLTEDQQTLVKKRLTDLYNNVANATQLTERQTGIVSDLAFGTAYYNLTEQQQQGLERVFKISYDALNAEQRLVVDGYFLGGEARNLRPLRHSSTFAEAVVHKTPGQVNETLEREPYRQRYIHISTLESTGVLNDGELLQEWLKQVARDSRQYGTIRKHVEHTDPTTLVAGSADETRYQVEAKILGLAEEITQFAEEYNRTHGVQGLIHNIGERLRGHDIKHQKHSGGITPQPGRPGSVREVE